MTSDRLASRHVVVTSSGWSCLRHPRARRWPGAESTSASRALAPLQLVERDVERVVERRRPAGADAADRGCSSARIVVRERLKNLRLAVEVDDLRDVLLRPAAGRSRPPPPARWRASVLHARARVDQERERDRLRIAGEDRDLLRRRRPRRRGSPSRSRPVSGWFFGVGDRDVSSTVSMPPRKTCAGGRDARDGRERRAATAEAARAVIDQSTAAP